MELSIEEVLDSATEEERQTLGRVLDTRSFSPDSLLKMFQKRSLNIFQRLNGSAHTYEEILVKVAEEHGVRRRLFEKDEDLERRLVRRLYDKLLSKMSSTQRKTYIREMQRKLTPHAVGAGGLFLAQASGFGIYQMASTVLGALTATAGLKLPFLAYMAMSKAISLAIGPLGWIGLGVGVLHTLTKPNYDQLMEGIACVSIIRQRINPCWEWRGYSINEIIRRGGKALALLSLIVCLALVIRVC